jgi:nitrogenase subunit NifH
MTIITYDPDSNGAQDYMALTKEVIAQEKKILKFKGVKAKKQKTKIREHAFS